MGQRTPASADLGATLSHRERDKPLATVAKIKSAQRLVAVDRLGQRLGLRSGMALADARAMHPALVVADADPRAEAELLACVVDWSRRFTPLAALDAPDGAMLDVAGAAHLFGGETRLLAEIETRLARQGFAATAAVADTPEGAWALARFSLVRTAAPGAGAADLGRLYDPLPLAALRIEPDAVARFAQAGLRRIGDIAMRPRGPITARFGPAIFARYDALKGLAKSAISPRFEAPAYVAERRFVDGIVRTQDVEGTLAVLAAELARMLERHGEGARELRATFFRVDGAVRHLTTGTSRPLREPGAIVRLFRERIAAAQESSQDGSDSGFDAGFDPGYGFDVVRLAALAVEPFETPQATLSTDAMAPTGDLADLIDRLGARLGIRRVMRFEPVDTHIPEFAVRGVAASTCAKSFSQREKVPPEAVDEGLPSLSLAPHGGPARASSCVERNPSSDRSAATFTLWEKEKGVADRPIRLLATPEPIEAIAAVPDGPPLKFRWRRVLHELAAVEGPERIAPEWWHGTGADTSGADPSLTRDYFCAEDTDGHRFWLFRQGLFTRETAAPRWYLHGLFG